MLGGSPASSWWRKGVGVPAIAAGNTHRPPVEPCLPAPDEGYPAVVAVSGCTSVLEARIVRGLNPSTSKVVPNKTKPRALALRIHFSFPTQQTLIWLIVQGTQEVVAQGRIAAAKGPLAPFYPLMTDWSPNRPAIPSGICHTLSSSRAFIRALIRTFEPVESIIQISPEGGSKLDYRLPFADDEWQPWVEQTLAKWAKFAREYAGTREAGTGKSMHQLWEHLKSEWKHFGVPTGEEFSEAAVTRSSRDQPSAAPAKSPKKSVPTAEPRSTPRPTAPPIPAVDVLWDPSPILLQTPIPVERNLSHWDLHARATRWWVSNQTDELLCLPHCNIEQLEYQVRAALRVIGALRGRALLSDEVGLGKTIEAGLVLKEYLVRGMVQKFLILTQPSLVDQWAEELSSKFDIQVATTHDSECRSNPAKFWRDHPAVVASLPVVRQPGQCPHVQAIPWDLLIVDEAHHLRNRTSLSWATVAGIPRRFLLLLTATPVQNSLEELYNLVTLLQPGQLPSPKEFRARFIDPKKPRQPKEPEELRRLLGQVMIRNTRANSGVNLPPRRAETALFEPEPPEAQALESWEAELRESLATLSPSQSSLWGRLLLQAAGSSPAALLSALKSYPDRDRAARWSQSLILPSAWSRKCALLPPIAEGEGGVVVFTQFLATQHAIAEFLAQAKVPTTLMNGSTPAAQRQPMIEEFRHRRGALLLTQSGTEGRNLQFCHRMINFDLPWNPMEIEQRIGRLHRLGQTHPVRIHNFVQAGTLQEKLLNLLQEKLNLFELVVGETGLILGDRFGEDDFAEEILRRWRESQGRLDEAFSDLGNDLAQARDDYREVQKLDSTLFAQDYANL